MANSRRSTDRLAAALSRKNPQGIHKEAGQALERARQQVISAGREALEREREMLLAEIEARPERAARLNRALSAAGGDINLARAAETTLSRVPRPDPKGLLLAGQVDPGRTGGAAVSLVFTDAEGRALEGTPEIEVAEPGFMGHVIAGRELGALQKALGERGRAFVSLKVGRRVVATTAQPLEIRAGAALQFNLRRP
jgi:hypothetical protein